jgi:hypothetical protein
MLSMRLPRSICSQLGRRTRDKSYYLRQWMLASREGRKLFDVQLKILTSRYTSILSTQCKRSLGPLDIKPVLERRMVASEPNFVEVRNAGVRADIPIVTPVMRIRLGHGVSPGPGNKWQRRDDRLGLHGVLSGLPLYFPYPRLSTTILRKENMRQPNARILGFDSAYGGRTVQIDLLEFLKGTQQLAKFTNRTLGIREIRKEISRSAEVVALTDGSPPLNSGFLIDNGA